MFSKEFYPTPDKVIKKMIAPYVEKYTGYYGPAKSLCGNLTILEPSAGKGNILDYLKKINERDELDLYCIEQDQELQYILQEKGYRLIATDFLSYSGGYHFDLIIMNPPFSNGDEHLLHAWDILTEGDIVCLLNSDTLNNPYTERRKLINSLIERHGSVEHVGSVFTDAERKTGVDCCIVRLKKVASQKKFDFQFESVTKERSFDLDENTFKDELATRDVIGNMILQYEALKEQYVAYIKAIEGMSFYQVGLTDSHTSAFKIANETLKRDNLPKSYNAFMDAMKQQIWGQIMSKTNVEKYMTHSVRKNFQQFAAQQGCMDFTKENVASMVSLIFNNRYNIMEQAIVDVFDIFTKYHADNRCHVEGWKTNSAWKCNRKVILPNYVTCDFGSSYRINYQRHDEYSDIDKVMCYLSGTNYDTCLTLRKAIEGVKSRDYQERVIVPSVKYGDSSRHESEFFYFRCYKKGTLHIEFKDKKLWELFNIHACAGKNWLPEEEMKKYRKGKENMSGRSAHSGLKEIAAPAIEEKVNVKTNQIPIL